MLSRDCDGCSIRKECELQFIQTVKGEFVYCPPKKGRNFAGDRHLVDVNLEWIKR